MSLFLAKGRDASQRKPPVPNIRDAPKMGARTEKNFIQTNALDVVMTVPKKPERNVVDDRFGDKFPIDPSGLTPKYVTKKVSRRSSVLGIVVELPLPRISVKCPCTSKHAEQIWTKPNKSIKHTFRITFAVARCEKCPTMNGTRSSVVCFSSGERRPSARLLELQV